jgi:hypothetical protein
MPSKTTPRDALGEARFFSAIPVCDRLMGLIQKEWLCSLDFATLEKMPGDFVSEDVNY